MAGSAGPQRAASGPARSGGIRSTARGTERAPKRSSGPRPVRPRTTDDGTAIGRAPATRPGPSPTLVADEHEQQDGRAGEREPGPGRPARRLPADQRVQEQSQRSGHEHDTARIELQAGSRARFPDQPPGEGNGDDAEGEGYEKHRSPPETQQVGAEQQAA